jgi:hypothetical protein
MCKDGTTDVFIGIDVSKDRLDICLRPSGEIFAVMRDDEGLEHLVERLRLVLCWSHSRRRADTRAWSQARSPPRICPWR